MTNKINVVSGPSLVGGSFAPQPEDIYVGAGDNGFVVWSDYDPSTVDERAIGFNVGLDGVVGQQVLTSDIPAFFGPAREESGHGFAILADGTLVGGFISESSSGAPGLVISSDTTTSNFTITSDLTANADFTSRDVMEVVALADGGFAVLVYYRTDTSDRQIDLLYYDRTGTLQEAIDVSAVVPRGPSEMDSLQMSPSPDGGVGLLIAINADVSNPDEHFLINFDGDGNLLGSALEVANGDDFPNLYYDNDLAVLRDGRVAVAYEADGQNPSDATQMYVRIANAEGTQLGSPILVSEGLVGGDYNEYASVVATQDGGFIVAWSHDVGTSDIVYLRRFDFQGEPVGPVMELPGQIDGDTHSGPDIAINEDGQLIVAYESVDADGPVAAVFEVEPIPSPYDDQLAGTARADTVYLLDGDDQYFGLAGADVIFGNNGDDFIFGGGSADSIFGGADDDSLFGDSGNDSIFGGDGDDYLKGGSDVDRLFGGDDDDLIFGGRADDKMFGGAGSDRLRGGFGEDYIEGGGGADNIKGKSGSDKLKGKKGADEIQGNLGADIIQGNRGNDDLSGNKGFDLIRGNKGNDDLSGGRGNDDLFGGKGNDDVFGNKGNDLIVGGKGRDDLYGGSGSDEFKFKSGDGRDVIHDFNADEDLIVIRKAGGYTTQQDGDDLLIRYGSDNQIRVKDLSLAEFDTSMIDLG